LQQLAHEGRPPAPTVVERQYRDLLRERELRANLQRLRDLDVPFEYHAVDVRDSHAWGRWLQEIQGRLGPFSGVVHGAGVIEDRWIRDKTSESFDRVFDTKVASARVLVEHLDPRSLKFLAFFGSLAGRFGNAGQADYAAANEVLRTLARQLGQTWPCRVVTMAWGPWSGVGMVAELESHLRRRGMRLIGPDEGPSLLIDELLYGPRRDAEVMLGGGSQETFGGAIAPSVAVNPP
ncbi:MAG TPA: SDR family NAD(P)-dependent oxidoreductase, partial [Pirellulaceae bacterium]